MSLRVFFVLVIFGSPFIYFVLLKLFISRAVALIEHDIKVFQFGQTRPQRSVCRHRGSNSAGSVCSNRRFKHTKHHTHSLLSQEHPLTTSIAGGRVGGFSHFGYSLIVLTELWMDPGSPSFLSSLSSPPISLHFVLLPFSI